MMMMMFKNSWLLAAIVSLTSYVMAADGRILQTEVAADDRVRTDFVRLTPFDVQLLITGPVAEVNINALTDIVTDWMSDSFVTKSTAQEVIGNETSFDSLGLQLSLRRRNLQDGSGTDAVAQLNFFSATYEGVTLWERRGTATPPVDQEIVEFIQRATFLEDRELLDRLQSAQANTGLGESVFDVRVFIGTNTQEDTSDSNNNNLEIIIIIAIVVACLAFGLLMFAVIWAWRTDQSKRDAYKVGDRSLQQVHVPTGSESEYNEKSPTAMTPASGMTPPATAASRASSSIPSRPPAEISPSANEYPESVISEDISTSLTAYYRSGMVNYSANNTRASSSAAAPPREFNDAASMSSMDSYGYSLDGYAPSLGPAPHGYPVGPLNGMIKDPDADYDADDDAQLTSSIGDSINQ